MDEETLKRVLALLCEVRQMVKAERASATTIAILPINPTIDKIVEELRASVDRPAPEK